jgi:hypothetical protein
MSRALVAERLQNLLDSLTARTGIKQVIIALEGHDRFISLDERVGHASGRLAYCGRYPVLHREH